MLEVQPPPSAELNPLEFYVQENLKNLFYSDPIENEETLQQTEL